MIVNINRVLMFGLILAMLAFPTSSQPRDNGQLGNQWGNSFSPSEISQWFKNLMRPDQPASSCCGEADAYEADSFDTSGAEYVAIITDGKGVIPNGTRITVPIKKMKIDGKPPNPTGHGIIFIGSSGTIYCYVTPNGG
jgi:hypothetical protein